MSLFQKVLIANRGEIALRVARACRELGIATVAVYSTEDRDSAVVRYADEAVRIGPAPAKRSYLSIPAIVEAALGSGADAVHPGYGFLSEDPDLAEVCRDNGLNYIGPPAEVIARLGDKTAARQLMSEVGLPMLPGSLYPLHTVAEAEQVAGEIGYPVSVGQQDIVRHGAAMECRINAEDLDRDFAPAPGVLDEFWPAGGPFTRVDTHAYPGYTVPASYDSLLAKLIVWAPTRPAVLSRMDRALEEFRVRGRGVSTTIGFLRRVLGDPRFAAGEHDTAIVGRLTSTEEETT